MTESERDVFDVDACVVVGVAELFGLLWVDEFCVDDGVLALAPFEELQVFLVLGLVVEVDLILLNLLAGQIIAIQIG